MNTYGRYGMVVETKDKVVGLIVVVMGRVRNTRLIGMQPLAPEILPYSSSEECFSLNKTHSGGLCAQNLQLQN